jgi:glycosyltransferase involved in cell wall biosynthesis
VRIALLSWETLHSIPVGGVAAHVTELASALNRRGHEVHVFTRMARGQSTYGNHEGVHYHRCTFDLHPDFVTEVDRMCNSFIWRMGEVENYLNGPFDIVHGHDWLCAKGVVQAKNNRKQRTVFTMHSTEYGRCGNQLCGGQAERVRHVEWEGTYVADRVICVSGNLQKEVRDVYRVPDYKTHVIYNGVNVKKYDGAVDIAAIRSHYGIGLEDPMVLYVGRMAWQKGPDLLLAAAPSLLQYYPGVKFVFVGDGEMRSGLECLAAEMGVSHATRFLGYRNGGELVGLFKSADLICVPSRNEPFGIVILEAWSAAKPVVTTRNGGPAEFVHHGYTGLTVLDNMDSIGWGIGTAFADYDTARWMGRNGRHEAESRFTWDMIARETEEVYQSI